MITMSEACELLSYSLGFRGGREKKNETKKPTRLDLWES